METQQPVTTARKVKRLKYVNTSLEVLIFLVALFFIFAPLLPSIGRLFAKNTEVPPPSEVFDPHSLFSSVDPSVDYLVIPSLGIAREIIEADSIKQVHESVWRRPGGSTPALGSNTILVAHRYATIGGNRSSTFYALPDIAIGAAIYVRWEGIVYEYQALGTTIVLPTQIDIENPTETPLLTLYTCTPLWKADKRFVVTAPLVATYP